MAEVAVKSSRNGLIEILRFVFALVVLMVHTHGLNPTSENYPFAGGYVAVEFFLILSGFFCAKYFLNVSTDVGKTAFSYSTKRFLQVVAAAVIPTAINYVVVYLDYDKGDLPYMLYEMLLMPMSGIYKTFVNLPLWYLSAYFICMPLFTYLIGKSKDFFVNIGSVLVPLLVYGMICRQNIHLDIWTFDSPIPFVGLLRVMAGLCMGLNCFRLCTYFKSVFKPSIIKKLPLVGTALIAVVLAYVFFFTKTYADYFLVVLICVAVACIFAGINSDSRINNKFCCFLGKWSLYIYLSHWTIRHIMPRIFPNYDYWQLMPIYLIAALAYSLIIMGLSSLLQKLCDCIVRKVVLNDTEV